MSGTPHCNELKINFASLEQALALVRKEKIKSSILGMIKTLKKDMQDFNDSLKEDSIISRDALKDQIDKMLGDVKNTEAGVKSLGLSVSEKSVTGSIFQKLREQYNEALTKLSAADIPQPIKELDWKMHHLRFQQNQLRSEEIYKQALERVEKEASGFKKPRVFICYAWPDPKHRDDKDLHWIQSFLQGLKKDLTTAGIHGVHLDIEDSQLGGNIYQYMEQSKTNDFVLLIGTPSLLRKHGQGVSSVCNELINIKRKRAKDVSQGNFRVIPILLNGEMESSFPAYLELYVNSADWQTKTYFQHVRQLIGALYEGSGQAFDEIWGEFLTGAKQKSFDLLLTQELDKEAIDKLLADERSREEEQKRRQNAQVEAHLAEQKRAAGAGASSYAQMAEPLGVAQGPEQRVAASPAAAAPAVSDNPPKSNTPAQPAHAVKMRQEVGAGAAVQGSLEQKIASVDGIKSSPESDRQALQVQAEVLGMLRSGVEVSQIVGAEARVGGDMRMGLGNSSLAASDASNGRPSLLPAEASGGSPSPKSLAG